MGTLCLSMTGKIFPGKTREIKRAGSLAFKQ
jgi:hypothetical protein